MLRLCTIVTAAIIGVSSLAASVQAFEGKPGAGKGKAGKKPHATPEERMKRLDKNNDGKISLEEMKSGGLDPVKAEARFKRLDKDNDGFVSLAELKAGAENHAKKK